MGYGKKKKKVSELMKKKMNEVRKKLDWPLRGDEEQKKGERVTEWKNEKRRDKRACEGQGRASRFVVTDLD